MAPIFLHEVWRGVRGLWRARKWRAPSVLVLGLALGTNGVLIGVLGHLFLAMPPLVRDPHSIFRVQRAFSIPGRGTVVNDALSYPQYAAIVGRNSDAAQVAGSYVMSVSIGEGADSRRAAAAFVTDSYFHFLGVVPEIGRTFTADESDQLSGAAVVVLGHDLWVYRFGASREVLGRTLRVGRSNYRIIGVLPASFHGTGERPAGLWLPLAVAGSISYGSAWDFDDGAFWIRAFVRIPSGIAPTVVASRLSAALTPPGRHSSLDARVLLAPLNAPSGRQQILQDRIALWLGGLALAVLLIVCANIGNSFLALGIERRADTAVRLALGGSRWLLGANVLGEAMGLSACGGTLGLVLAVIFSRAIAGPLQAVGIDQAAEFDGTLVVTMLVLVFLVGILTAVLPLLALRERSLQPVLRSAAVTPDPGHERVRLVLLAGQVALTTALVAGAGLFVQSFNAVRRVDPGFDQDHVLVADLDPLGEATAREVETEYAEVQERLRTDPRVAGSSIAVTAPFLSGVSVRIVIPGVDSLPGNPNSAAWVNGVTPDFFSVLRLRPLSGRLLRASDGNGPPVAVITKRFAVNAWGSADPLHRCFHVFSTNTPCLEVVGVIADPERDKLGEAAESQFFVPLEQAPRLASTRLLLIRFKGAAAAATAGLVRVIQKALPNAPYPQVQSLSAVVGGQRRPWAWGATLLVFFSALAVLIAGLGLHSALQREVKARERDLAIRAALGADRVRLAATAIRRVGAAVLAGLACGLVAGWVLGARLQPVLFRTPPVTLALDAAIVMVTLTMFAISVLGPVLRVARTDIATVLRRA